MKVYTGKTLEDLLAKIAAEKKCEVEEIHYFVKEEKKGFLGIGNQVTAEAYVDEDVAEFIEDYLQKFFNSLGLQVETEVQLTDDCYRVLLNAENNAILIGKNGQTLEAMNIVLKGAVSAEFKKKFHVLVDINNYKTDRYDKIKGIAYRVARSVQRTHVTATLDPMPADERRVVHNFLSEVKNIRTESVGDGRDRRITIVYDENN